MSFNDIKIFEKLTNLIQYTDISTIEQLDNIISDTIDIDISKTIQDEYIKSYAKEFEQYFNSIDDRNDNEIESSSDTEAITRYKNDLYNIRIEAIKTIKSYFLKSIFYIKQFKGTQDYIEYILSFYVNMKYYGQYDLSLETEESSGSLKSNIYYVITLTEKDYFGSGKLAGNIIKLSNSKVLSANNKVQEITSKDSVIITAGTAQFNKKYLIVKNTGTLIDLVAGNTLVYRNVPDSLTFSSSLIVKEIIPVIVEKTKDFVYIVQSIISENEYNEIIKPLVHPVGWLSYYYDIDEVNSSTEFLQNKNIDIIDQMTLQNLNYYYHNIALNDIRSNSLIETLYNNGSEDIYTYNIKLFNLPSQLDFCLLSSNIDLIANVVTTEEFNFVLEFSNALGTNYLDANVIELWLKNQDIIYTPFVITSNIVAATGVITIDALDMTDYLIVGDSIVLTGFANAGNNSTFVIGTIDYDSTTALATTITVVDPTGMVNETLTVGTETITVSGKDILTAINIVTNDKFLYITNTDLLLDTETYELIIDTSLEDENSNTLGTTTTVNFTIGL